MQMIHYNSLHLKVLTTLETPPPPPSQKNEMEALPVTVKESCFDYIRDDINFAGKPPNNY